MPYNVVLVIAVLYTLSSAAQKLPRNPIRVKSSEFLGNVTSTNSGWGRDLGWQGQIDSCFINTFGDDFKCSGENPQEDCFFGTSSRNSCGQPTSSTTYEDYFLNNKNEPQPCVAPIGDETVTTPMGITNVIQTGPGTGVLFVLPGNPSMERNTLWQGAAYALVNINSDCTNLTITRPEINLWNGDLANTDIGGQPYNESYYGDHGALLGQDQYLYLYGSIPNHEGMAVARARIDSATNLDGYEYWNGTAFQTERIQNPTGAVSIMKVSQGSAFWSAHYQRYIYLSTNFNQVTARTAVNPWGPWSGPKTIWTLKQMPYRLLPALDSSETFYSPAVQPKYASVNGTDVVIWVTYAIGKTRVDDRGGHEIGTAVRVVFEGEATSGNSTSTGGSSGGSNGGSTAAPPKNGATSSSGAGSVWAMLLAIASVTIVA